MRPRAIALLSLAVPIAILTACALRYTVATQNLVPPKVLKASNPSYTKAAMDAHVTGSVELMLRIGADGRPDRVRVVKSLDKIHGLDAAAVSAARRYEFSPATLNGKPVAVEDVQLSMSFRIY